MVTPLLFFILLEFELVLSLVLVGLVSPGMESIRWERELAVWLSAIAGESPTLDVIPLKVSEFLESRRTGDFKLGFRALELMTALLALDTG